MQASFLSLLVLAVIFVNGWTDAPNSIATVVSTRALSFRRAAALAALCDLAGVMVMSLLCPTVAETVLSIAHFGGDPKPAFVALQATLLSIVLWAVLAWRFGIPTSESHALIAGLTGASLALHGGLEGVNAAAWGKILAGLLLSTVCGALAGRWAAKKIRLLPLSPVHARRGQIACAGAMAFLHGAQDGQKFLALFLLTRSLAAGQTVHTFCVSPTLALICAATMAAGVACGGRRIINSISQGVTGLGPRQGLAADLAGGICLLAASAMGLPVSTTHTKISAIFGVGTESAPTASNGKTARKILLAWLATFPCCGFLAWLLTRVILIVM